MSAKPRGRRLLSLAVALVVGAMCMAAVRVVDVDAGSDAAMELQAPAEGTNPGAYCRIPDHGAYFLGRDFHLEFQFEEDFTRWCKGYGGVRGWTE